MKTAPARADLVPLPPKKQPDPAKGNVMSTYKDILYEQRGEGVVWITINRPESYNAFRGQTVDELIDAHRTSQGSAPRKLAFTLWSTETMRHLGMLEAQVLYALGMRPQWDAGGRVTGVAP